MKIDIARDAPWLKPLIAALQPDSLTMRAFEQTERIVRAAREREAGIDLERRRWINA